MSQSITHTTFPDGSVLTYTHGMPKPKLEDMSNFVKESLMRKINGNKFKKDFDPNYGEKLLKEANQLIQIK